MDFSILCTTLHFNDFLNLTYTSGSSYPARTLCHVLFTIYLLLCTYALYVLFTSTCTSVWDIRVYNKYLLKEQMTYNYLLYVYFLVLFVGFLRDSMSGLE